ncbi:MAG TPA: hypothetical protein VF791_20135 [Pyrinomonadaceae bacterium]
MKPRLLLISLFLAVWMNVAVVSAQNTGTPATLSALPTSDVVGYVNAGRILTEIIPRLLAKDPATLVKMMNTVNELYAKTGISLLSIESVAAGLQFVGPATHNMKKENLGLVIIIHGDFDANKLVAFIKSESKGKHVEETYGGKVIYSEPRPAPPGKKVERETAAATILDANTFAVGDLPQVRATIDAASGKGRVDSALIQLATRDPGTLIGMAGNVPSELTQDISKTAPPDEMAQAVTKIIANIKQVFGSIGASPADFNLILGARLGSAEQAQSLSDMLLGIRQQVSPKVDDLRFRELLNKVEINADGDAVQLKANIPNEIAQEAAASIIKERADEAKSAKAKPKTKPKARRGRRRR